MKKIIVFVIIAIMVFIAVISIGFFHANKTAHAWLEHLMFANKPRIERREANAHDVNRNIKIGIAGPTEIIKKYTLFYQGIQMAVDEINSNGGVIGMELEAVIGDDHDNLTETLEVGQNFALDTDVVAVIGHWTSTHTIPTAELYNETGVLLMTPTATNQVLTQSGYKTVFRNAASDMTMGQKMASYAQKQGYKNIAIYYADSMDGKELSKSFEKYAKESGIQIIDRHSNFVSKDEFDATYKEWKLEDVDAVFVADLMMNAKDIVSWIRQQNETLPILSGNGFDYNNMIEFFGDDSENIAFTSCPTGKAGNKLYSEFENNFFKKFGVKPDYYAAKGYESIQIICDAIKTTKSTSPSELVGVLKSGKRFEGINGAVSFDESGQMKSCVIIVKKVVHGKYVSNY